MSEITEYLNQKGIAYKQQGGEVIITCPNCHKEKLYINTRSLLYHCFYCETINPESLYAKGHFSQFQESFGDIISITPSYKETPFQIKEEKNFTNLVQRYKFNLKESKAGQKYLYNRGFDENDIERFNLGFVEMKGESWISIPAFEDDVPKFIKYRKITNNTDLKKYERQFGSKTILYNQDVLKKYDEVYIVGGEFDAMMMIKNGYENTVASTSGEGALTSYMYDKLYLKNNFILILDSDPVGQKAARDVWAKRLGVGRCHNITLPKDEDINSFFLKYGAEEFQKYLEKKYHWLPTPLLPLISMFFRQYNPY